MFNLFSKRVYLDYASLTPVDKRVQREIKKYSKPQYANPSSLYKEGVLAKKALEEGRKKSADFLGAQPDEIVFTGGGTEGNNLAILGGVESLREKGVEYSNMEVIGSIIEHSSVRECFNYLQGKGVTVHILGVDKNGLVSPEELKKKISPKTVLVSIMTVNNEIGSIQPIREFAKIIRQARASLAVKAVKEADSPFNFQSFSYPIFHTDACQAALYEELKVEKLGVDLLTLDGSKVYGPRGVGLLYVKRNTPIAPIIFGGGQEKGRRSGTENLPGVMGLAKALQLAEAQRTSERERVSVLREVFLEGLKKIRPDMKINGGELVRPRLTNELSTVCPHIINISLPGIDNEFFVLQLDARGVAVSTKSSCLRDEDESFVLKAIGADSKTSIRVSFGRMTTKREVRRALKIVMRVLSKKLRYF